MSYKHFIFDMGNVLMDFNPKYILSMYFDEIDKINYYYEFYFKSGLWSKLDNGDLSFEQLIEDIQKSESKDKNLITDFLRTWHFHKWERKKMTEIIKQLAKKGYSIHICSNAPKKIYTYINKYEFFKYIDSFTISADYKISKPNKKIYEIVLQENDLKPHNCLFIDDLGENIKSAEELGIDGYLYNGNELMFKKFLNNLNII